VMYRSLAEQEAQVARLLRCAGEDGQPVTVNATVIATVTRRLRSAMCYTSFHTLSGSESPLPGSP
jgi:hypothetical protein